jgi:hypothetical protein
MKGKCKYLDYENNKCLTDGGQCVGKEICEYFEEEEE